MESDGKKTKLMVHCENNSLYLGICHGTSGNAYLFLHLYKLTKDDIYLQRAILFMQAVIENGVGVSGSRCSLFQGLAGVGCLVNDIVNIETFKGIPGISI